AFLVIHTLQHATFGSRRPWISEGVAHFAQAKVAEQQLGRDGALAFMDKRRVALALAEPDKPQDVRNSLIQTTDEVFYRTKAMYVWWMLRDMIGEEPLRAALNKYSPAADKEPAYVQHLLEVESKKDLEKFFDDWVYRDRGLPDFKIVSVFPRQSLKGGY